MIKKIISLAILLGISATVIGLSLSGLNSEEITSEEITSEEITSEEINSEEASLETEEMMKADVVIPTKVSRPGCDIEDICYIPSKIIVEKGGSVTWLNEDSAFHTVTSGFYGEPTELFDSGYLDPYQYYTLSFDEIGTFDYFCELHPWMFAQVIVE
jgi:plastocyanin